MAGPVLADSDRPDLVNGTGDDPTQPLGKIELLDRYTEAPGPGVEEGTTKQVETNTPFARIEAPLRLAPQWELNFRAEIPVVWTNGVTAENPTGATVSGFGNVLTQALDSTRPGSTLGGRAWWPADRADLDERSGDGRLGAGHRFGRPRDAPGD